MGFLRIVTGLDPKLFPETTRAIAAIEAAFAVNMVNPEAIAIGLVAKGAERSVSPSGERLELLPT